MPHYRQEDAQLVLVQRIVLVRVANLDQFQNVDIALHNMLVIVLF